MSSKTIKQRCFCKYLISGKRFWFVGDESCFSDGEKSCIRLDLNLSMVENSSSVYQAAYSNSSLICFTSCTARDVLPMPLIPVRVMRRQFCCRIQVVRVLREGVRSKKSPNSGISLKS